MKIRETFLHSLSFNKNGAIQLPTLDTVVHIPVAVFLSTVGNSSAVYTNIRAVPVVIPNLPTISRVIDRYDKPEGKKKLKIRIRLYTNLLQYLLLISVFEIRCA